MIIVRSLILLSCLLRFVHAQEIQMPAGHPQVGVMMHFNNGWYSSTTLIHQAVAAGFTWVREDFYWSKMEQGKGVYALPSEYDRILGQYQAAGLKVLAIFNGGNPLYAPDNFNPEAFAAAAAWFAKAASNRVQAIEILNEPHNFGFRKHYGGTWNGVESNGAFSAWPARYVELLNRAAPAIKAANPAVKVVGLGSVPPVTFRQLAMGIAPEVDGITEHPYSPRLAAEYVPYASKPGILRRDGIATADTNGTFVSQMQMLRALAAEHQGPREIWLTEFGWPTYQEKGNANLFAGFTRNAQAKYLLRRLAEALGLGEDMLFVYNLRDNGGDRHNAEHNFGLLDINGQPKPSYAAVQRFNRYMARLRPGPLGEVQVSPLHRHADPRPVIWDGSLIEADGRAKHYSFVDPQGRGVLLLWSAERADGDQQYVMGTVTIATAQAIQSVTRYDLWTGQTSSIPHQMKDGLLLLGPLTIPDYPVALHLN